MEKKFIYTIGREYGSGGREIGETLAKELGIPCYDKEILADASKESGYCEEIFKSYDEKPVTSLLYSMAMGNLNTFVSTKMPISVEAFLAQYHTIERLAEEGPCVFIGRCSDYVLKDRKDVINVFITGDENSKAKRVMARHEVSETVAISLMKKNDKNRASYYSYYTEQKWGDAKNYNLCLDSGRLGIDGCVKMIREFAKTQG